MELLETLSLFRWAAIAALLAGACLPPLGAFLFLGRSGFLGLVLPQVATAGVAFGYAILPLWIAHIGLFGLELEEALADPHAASSFLLSWAALAVLLCQAAFARGARPELPDSARQAAWFAGASAAAVLLGGLSPLGTEWIDALLRGELLTVDEHGVEILAVAYGLALALVLPRWRALVLAGLDPSAARVLGLVPGRRKLELALALGLCTAASAVVVGPLVGFSLLVLPPLAARPLARSLLGFLTISSAIGLSSSALGLLLSFSLDVPLGAALAVAGAVFAALTGLGGARRQAAA